MDDCIYDDGKLESIETTDCLEYKICPKCKAEYKRLPPIDAAGNDYWVITLAKRTDDTS